MATLTDKRRAHHVLSRDMDTAAGAGFQVHQVGPDVRSAPREVARDHEPLRKMPPPARRYWPTPNSQRAPRRPQVKKVSAK